MAVLTSVSLTVSEEKREGCHGVLTAITDDGETVIASLFPSSPQQLARLVWRKEQDLRLRAAGNFSLTLSLLTRDVDF